VVEATGENTGKNTEALNGVTGESRAASGQDASAAESSQSGSQDTAKERATKSILSSDQVTADSILSGSQDTAKEKGTKNILYSDQDTTTENVLSGGQDTTEPILSGGQDTTECILSGGHETAESISSSSPETSVDMSGGKTVTDGNLSDKSIKKNESAEDMAEDDICKVAVDSATRTNNSGMGDHLWVTFARESFKM
jgi:hypothetical protein